MSLSAIGTVYSTDLKWLKECHACPDCRKAMNKIGTFRGVPQWLCVECGWVSIGEGDARWT